MSVKSIPRPQLNSDNDVLIKVKMAGLCRTDVYVAQGKIHGVDPLILGHEFSGIIQETGRKISHLKSGDRVTVNPLIPCGKCHFCQNGKEASCQNSCFLGIQHQGAFAEYIVVPGSAVYQLPHNLDFKTGAYSEPVAASLAVLKADIKPNEKGLIYGDNRISHLTLKILEAYNFCNVTIYNIDEKEYLSPDTYDFIIETLATTEALSDIVGAIRHGGKIILKSRQHQPIEMILTQILKKEPIFYAVNYGSFEEAVSLLANRKVDFSDLLVEEFKLEEFEQVFALSQYSDSRKLFFRF